ncbi:hypothetical protein GPJ61_12755 [Brevibacillus formosus]|uniref:Ig-like domain-containing protein n=1 Tax=Brevibacillus formosus TaxID=54913 RepID=UPI001CA4A4F4|nr:Ig-like domain-containing protein [Brevibacillus formosus]MBW5468726.1 hypothetical protein [Brevibacillus formosus]
MVEGTTTGQAKAALEADKKSVVITFADKKPNNTAFTFQVDGVTDVEGNKVTSEVQTITVTDTVAPTITETKFAATGDLTITFSEPLAATQQPIVRVNNTPVAHTPVVAGDTVVTVPAANLPAIAGGATATVFVSSAQDTALNTMAVYNGTVVKAVDTTKPAITSVTQTGQNTVKVVVSEELAAGDSALQPEDLKVLIGSKVYTHGVDGTVVTVGLDTNDTTNKTYNVSFNLEGKGAPNYGLYASNTAAAAQFTLIVDANAIKDAYNNGNDAYNQGITLNRDAQGPRFVSSKVAVDKKTLELTFDEAFQGADTAVDETKLLITNAEGVRFTALDATTVVKSDNDKVLVVDFTGAAEIENGTYTVQIGAGAVKDALGNLSAAATTTVTVGSAADTVKPTATLDTETTTDAAVTGVNKFVVDFSEEVGASALDLANYKLDGVALDSTKANIYFNSSAKNSVTIELKAETVAFGAQAGTPATLTVSNVADKAGNVMEKAADFGVNIADNTAAVLQTVQVLGNDIVLTFNENIDSTTATAIDTPEELAAEFEILVGSDVLTLGTLGTGGADGAAGDAAVSLVAGNAKQVKISLTPQVNGTGYTGQVSSNWDPTKTITVKTTGATLKDANEYGVKADVTAHN